MKSTSLQDNIIIFSLATLVNIINRNVLRFEEINENDKDDKNILKEKKKSNSDKETYNNGYISGIESNDILITELNSESGIKKNQELDEFKIKDIDDNFNKKNSLEKNSNNISKKNKNNFRSKTFGMGKKPKFMAKSILKKKGHEERS